MGALIISIENSHEYGSILPDMLRLRYREFKERQSYDIPTFKNMEYDNYDTPATVYVVWKDEQGEVRGCSRMAPTDRPYMIKDIWPGIVTKIPLPSGDDIWESSRFCIDKTCSVQLRQQIKLEILQAKIEFALAVGMKGMIGVMPPLIWRAVFVNSGWAIDQIGPITELETGEKVVAGWIHVNSEILSRIRMKTQLSNSLLAQDGMVRLLLKRVA